MKRIIVLNGAARKNGNTAELIKAFTDGANAAGNMVREFYLADMNIHGCMGCECCNKTGADVPCVQLDDMREIYKAFEQANVVVFASPVYFWTISGTLKTAADRLYAELRHLGYGGFPRESVLLMTAGGSDYSQAVTWYRTFEKNLGWKNRGEILGSGKTKEAYRLGEIILIQKGIDQDEKDDFRIGRGKRLRQQSSRKIRNKRFPRCVDVKKCGASEGIRKGIQGQRDRGLY